MNLLVILLLVAAAVCFGLGAAGVGARVNLIAVGLLCWVVSVLIPALAAA